MTDLSQPNHDGAELLEGFNPWRGRRLTYTVRPGILSPLVEGREYHLFVRAIGKAAAVSTLEGYGRLYARVHAIANKRVAQLQCVSDDHSVSARILMHGWYKNDALRLATAFLTMEVVSRRNGEPRPIGLIAPTVEELSRPGGSTPENPPKDASSLRLCTSTSPFSPYSSRPSRTCGVTLLRENFSESLGKEQIHGKSVCTLRAHDERCF